MVGAFTPVRAHAIGIIDVPHDSLQFCPMTFRRSASVVGTIALVLMAHSAPASAHGVEVTAQIDDATATLELTDETGEVCIAIEPAPENAAVVAIVEDASDEILLILGEGVTATSSCQLFDVAIVNGILGDVDAHRLVVAFGNRESSGVLAKPRLPDSETATGVDDAVQTEAPAENGPNVPLVFGIGIALGLATVVIRKRFFS